MKQLLLRTIATFFGDARKTIFSVLILAALGGTAGVLSLSKTIADFFRQIATTPTPLWVTIAAVLLCFGYTYYIHRRSRPTSTEPPPNEPLIEAFGVYWTSDFKPRCLKCKWPLKRSRMGASILYCCNCDQKHALRAPNGPLLTESEAIELLKTSEPSDATEAATGSVADCGSSGRPG